MKFLLLYLWAVVCVLIGDWMLRKGITFQLKGIRKGIWIQLLAAFVTLVLPMLIAVIAK